MKNILIIILIICCTGCVLSIKNIPYEKSDMIRLEERSYQEKIVKEQRQYQENLAQEQREKILKEELLTEKEKIAKTLEHEAFLVWQAFQKAIIGKKWKDNFSIASYINEFYTKKRLKGDIPIRQDLYKYLRDYLVGTEKTIKLQDMIWIEPKNLWQTILFWRWPQKAVKQYAIWKTTGTPGTHRSDIIDKLLIEVENHYLLIKQMEIKNEITL